MTFEFQQLVADLRKDKIHPTCSPYGECDPTEMLRIYGENIIKIQQEGLYPNEFKKPLGVQFEVTHGCNLKCIQCYNQSGPDRISWCELSVKHWVKLAEELGKNDVFEAVISGGEPLLLKDGLFEIMDVFHDYGVTFILITNGWFLDGKTFDKLSKYEYAWLQISIDGSRPEIHDRIRGVKGSWKRAIKATHYVDESGIPLVIAHVGMKINKDYMGEMIDFAYLLGAQRIIADSFIYTGRAVLNAESICLTKGEKEKIYEVTKQKSVEYGNRMSVITAAEPAISLRYRLIEPSSVVLIRPNGDVGVDCLAPFKIGNVLENDLMEIWESIGKKIWRHPQLIEYVKSVKCNEDMLKVRPRSHVDEDVLLTSWK